MRANTLRTWDFFELDNDPWLYEAKENEVQL